MLKMGMVGGGAGSFIGSVHRMAARLDGKIEIVAGCFSSKPEKSIALAKEYNVARAYASYQEMFEAESRLPEDEKIDFVSVVTPTGAHYEVIMEALKYGFNVVSDKPMCITIEQAQEIYDKVKETGAEFCLTHNYTGYPGSKAAKKLIEEGGIGDIIRVTAEYPQGWLMGLPEEDRKSAWRFDPTKGVSFTMADIGCHTANLAEYITGMRIKDVCADLQSVIADPLDDDGTVMLKFDSGVKGVLWASSVLAGELNGLNIRVYGTKGCIYWKQEEPNSVLVKYLDKPDEILRPGDGTLGEFAQGFVRLPGGHPEGFIEAFANIYGEFAKTLEAKKNGEEYKGDYPTVCDGLHLVKFINRVLDSNKAQAWVSID